MKDMSTVHWAHTGRLLPPYMHQLMEHLLDSILLVSKLMKGAFHSRPPLPRYTNTWDVNSVIRAGQAYPRARYVSQAIVIVHGDVTIIDTPFQVRGPS